MIKMVKRQQHKKSNQVREAYHKVYQTDYNIPRFGYKSSFIILISTVFVLFTVPFFCEQISMDYRMPVVIFGGLTAGFSTVYAQFFIETQKGFTKYFWMVGGLLSLFCAMIIFVVVYTGIIM